MGKAKGKNTAEECRKSRQVCQENSVSSSSAFSFETNKDYKDLLTCLSTNNILNEFSDCLF